MKSNGTFLSETIRKRRYKQFKMDDKKKYFYITFRYMLPFKLPLPNMSSFNLEKTMIFCIQRKYPFYGLNEGIGHPDLQRTIVEVTTQYEVKSYNKSHVALKPAKKNIDDKRMTEVFDDQLKILNTFIEMISMKYQYHNIYSINKGLILGIPMCTIFSVYGDELIDNHNSIFLLKVEDKLFGDELHDLKNYEIDELIDNYEVIKMHPLRQMTFYKRKAERFLFNHDYNSAIANCQTSFEVFITFFVKHYYELLTLKDNEKINNIINSGNFKNIYKQHFLVALYDISTDYNDVLKEIFDYYDENCYQMRNDIVHKGVTFNSYDANTFNDVVGNIIYVINEKLKLVKNNKFASFYSRCSINQHERDINQIWEFYKKLNNKMN